MPKPILDAKIRQGIMDKLPGYTSQLQINDDSLTKKVKQLIDPILTILWEGPSL